MYKTIDKGIVLYDKINLDKAKKLRYGYIFSIGATVSITLMSSYIYIVMPNLTKKEIEKMEKNIAKVSNVNVKNENPIEIDKNITKVSNVNMTNKNSKEIDNTPNFDVDIENIAFATEGYDVNISKK